jgi:hypothetical protein
VAIGYRKFRGDVQRRTRTRTRRRIWLAHRRSPAGLQGGGAAALVLGAGLAYAVYAEDVLDDVERFVTTNSERKWEHPCRSDKCEVSGEQHPPATL